MDNLKATLSKRIGPFSIGVWILVFAAGIAIALIVRRRFAPSDARAEDDLSGSANVSGGGGLPGGVLVDSGTPLPGTAGAPATVGISQGSTREGNEIRAIFDRIEDMFQIISDQGTIRTGADDDDDPDNRPPGSSRNPNDPESPGSDGRNPVGGGGNTRPPSRGLNPPGMDSDIVLPTIIGDPIQPISGPTPTPYVAPVVRDPAPVKPPSTPTPTGRTYVVKRGDWLSKIAGRYPGVSWQDIYNANRAVIGSNPDLIHPGMVLTIPNG